MNRQEQLNRKREKARQVGYVCKRMRERAKLTVRDIANKTGYSTQLIYGFETGKTTNYLLLFDCYFSILPQPFAWKLYNEILSSLK